jgi:hypothetical protein
VEEEREGSEEGAVSTGTSETADTGGDCCSSEEAGVGVATLDLREPVAFFTGVDSGAGVDSGSTTEEGGASSTAGVVGTSPAFLTTARVFLTGAVTVDIFWFGEKSNQ